MNIFISDIGQGKLHVYDSKNDIFYGKLPQEYLIELNIPNIKKGDILVVEDAHLRESHKNTLAQPYSFEQLEKFVLNSKIKQIKILVFPQKSTPKARKLAGYESDSKTDETDTKSIAKFLKNDKEAFRTLKKFKPVRLFDYQEQNKHIFNYIQQSNQDINPAKSSEYGFGNIEYEDEISKWIKKYKIRICEYLDNNKELMEAIGLSFDKKGKLKTIKNPNRIYTIVSSILRPNGELRLREFPPGHKYYGKQLFPEWKFVKSEYFGCKPFHMRQGVPSSNYKHWMRKAVSQYKSKFDVGLSYDEYFKLKKERNRVDKITQKIWYSLRKMIVEDGLK